MRGIMLMMIGGKGMKEYFDANHDDVVSGLEILQFFLHFITKVVLYVIFILFNI